GGLHRHRLPRDRGDGARGRLQGPRRPGPPRRRGDRLRDHATGRPSPSHDRGRPRAHGAAGRRAVGPSGRSGALGARIPPRPRGAPCDPAIRRLRLPRRAGDARARPHPARRL
ncbi:MAG: hypothetical protein AVDCRST_MAG54-3842, partial [uncultured Actinomycetospora sp.]